LQISKKKGIFDQEIGRFLSHVFSPPSIYVYPCFFAYSALDWRQEDKDFL
jgi:hypothetical protein